LGALFRICIDGYAGRPGICRKGISRRWAFSSSLSLSGFLRSLLRKKNKFEKTPKKLMDVSNPLGRVLDVVRMSQGIPGDTKKYFLILLNTFFQIN